MNLLFFKKNNRDNKDTSWKSAGSAGITGTLPGNMQGPQGGRARGDRGGRGARAGSQITLPGDDVWYGRNWPDFGGSAATRTRREAGARCETEARARTRAKDAPREWSEGAMGRFPPARQARFEVSELPRSSLQ